MQNARDVLNPDALAMLQVTAESGSFAAAAQQLWLAPCALTYYVRHIEDALDVLVNVKEPSLRASTILTPARPRATRRP